MPKLELIHFSEFARQMIATNDSGIYQCKLLSPMPQPQVQQGQVCKLTALSVVLNWLHATDSLREPLPVRKNQLTPNHLAKYSLREIAKRNYGSRVGEVYDANILCAIARDSGYKNSDIITVTNEAAYIEVILKSINNEHVPIVFFDINRQTGDPVKANSKWEHAAVMTGYFVDKQNNSCVIAAQWGAYYWFPVKDLAASASQLSPCRNPETFYKYSKDWYEHEAMLASHPHLLFKPADETRTASSPSRDGGGLRNKIVIISKPSLTKLYEHESDQLFTNFIKHL